MKVNIKIDLCTDGDYSLRNYEKLGFIIDDEWDERYYCVETFQNYSEAISFLEKVLCEIHVLYTHYWLIKDFYELFDEAIEFIMAYKNDTGEFFEKVGGNYDGTFINIEMIKDDKVGNSEEN